MVLCILHAVLCASLFGVDSELHLQSKSIGVFVLNSRHDVRCTFDVTYLCEPYNCTCFNSSSLNVSPCVVPSNVEIGVTSDGKTVVCYHPSVEFPYELSQVRTITLGYTLEMHRIDNKPIREHIWCTVRVI